MKEITKMKKIIIIGGTSGIGEGLAKFYHKRGYTVGITGRRTELLQKIQYELKEDIYIQEMDISKEEETRKQFENLVNRMNGVDIVVISAAVGFLNENYDHKIEIDTIQINILGFTLISNLAIKYFIKQKHGHLVGISSISGLIPNSTVVYGASKAFMISYLEGLSCYVKKHVKSPIYVTDICPGFVDTILARGKVFWMSPVKKAVVQIANAIDNKKSKAYITKRWAIIAFIFKFLPSKWLPSKFL